MTNKAYTKFEFRWVGDELCLVWAQPSSYIGMFDQMKGDPYAEEEEQATANFDNSLMNIFQAQYATQSAQLQFLQNQMEPVIAEGGQGYTPTQLAAQRTGATDVNAQQFQSAQAALNEQISDNAGGSKLVGSAGTTAAADTELSTAEAQTQAASQNEITQNNAQLQQQNYWNAVNSLNGVAAQENPIGYAGASNSAGNTVAGLSQAVTASKSSSLLGTLGGIAGGIGSSLVTKYCWVAASFYGWHDIRTWVIRMWVTHKAPKWFKAFYIKHGAYIASTPLRWAFYPVFEAVLES